MNDLEFLVVDKLSTDTWTFNTEDKLLSFLNGADFDNPSTVADEVEVFLAKPVYVYTKAQVKICTVKPGH